MNMPCIIGYILNIHPYLFCILNLFIYIKEYMDPIGYLCKHISTHTYIHTHMYYSSYNTYNFIILLYFIISNLHHYLHIYIKVYL